MLSIKSGRLVWKYNYLRQDTNHARTVPCMQIPGIQSPGAFSFITTKMDAILGLYCTAREKLSNRITY